MVLGWPFQLYDSKENYRAEGEKQSVTSQLVKKD
jgi:hypothetical protein